MRKTLKEPEKTYHSEDNRKLNENNQKKSRANKQKSLKQQKRSKHTEHNLKRLTTLKELGKSVLVYPIVYRMVLCSLFFKCFTRCQPLSVAFLERFWSMFVQTFFWFLLFTFRLSTLLVVFKCFSPFQVVFRQLSQCLFKFSFGFSSLLSDCLHCSWFYSFQRCQLFSVGAFLVFKPFSQHSQCLYKFSFGFSCLLSDCLQNGTFFVVF